MLSVDGDADAAVEARIRIDWNKFRQLVPLLTNKDVSSKMTYIVSSGALNSTPTNQLWYCCVGVSYVSTMLRVCILCQVGHETLSQSISIVVHVVMCFTESLIDKWTPTSRLQPHQESRLQCCDHDLTCAVLWVPLSHRDLHLAVMSYLLHACTGKPCDDTFSLLSVLPVMNLV